MRSPFPTLALAVLLLGTTPCISQLHASDFKTITDMAGNKVEVPVDPKSIASMHCVSGPAIVTLGKGDRMSLMGKPSPWAYKLYPEIRDVQTKRTGKVDQLRELKVDLVLFTPGMFKGKGDEFKAAGFKTACAFSADKRPRTMGAFIDQFKGQMMFYGEILGPEGKEKAEKYCRYFDSKLEKILAITSKIDKKDRPSVYYGWKGGKALSSQGQGSAMHWNTEIAGGNYLPQAKDDNFAQIDKKVATSWDPDVIFISMGNVPIDSLKKDPEWASKKAVKNGKVYFTPEGIYNWDNASGETILLIIRMAKVLHPDLFKDWDMIKEMKTFYSEVYGKTVTDQDAARILECLPPL